MTKITDDSMTSGATPHTAARAAGGAWSVTWLPGRALTRDQAVTAMTIAEMVTERAAVLSDRKARLWWHVAGWAGELGLTAVQAAAMASEPAAPAVAARGPRHGETA